MDNKNPSGGTSSASLADGVEDSPSGISLKIVGLIAALCRHILELGNLAAQEAGHLIRQSLVLLILAVLLFLSIFIAYLAMIATGISLLIFSHGWGWPAAFGAVSLAHVLFAGIIIAFLRFQTLRPPFEATAGELKRDLEALTSYAKKSSTSLK